jgi:hypothetical protein
VVERAGLERVADDLYVTDLGVGTRPLSDGEQAWVSPDDIDPETLVGGAAMIAWARIFKRVLDTGEVKSRADIARIKGVSRANVTETMNLLKLAATIQEDLLAGKFGGVSGHGLRNIVKLKGEAAQRAALEEYVRTTAAEGTAHLMRPRKHGVTQTLPIRRVAYFNPEMLVTQRLHDRDRRRRIDVFVEQLNEQLRRPGSRKSEADVRFAVMERLSKDKSLRLYNIDIATDADPVADRECLQVTLTLREDQWRRRRCYDGFVLLLAHAGLPHSAEELAKLYRDKDTIERDFRVIKDVVGLRPVYHHTDDKVRAHVTICMLALLIQRAIEIRLAAAGRQMTADRCLEELATCRLNRFEANELLDFDYSVTKPTEEQLGLLKALGASDLVKHQKVADQLKPR